MTASPALMPPASATPDHDTDFHDWCLAQAELLRAKRFDLIDLENLIEEIGDMGNEQRRALESSYRLVLMHLLKWEFQPQRRSRSWLETISRERANIEDFERDNRALANRIPDTLQTLYVRARRHAAAETMIDIRSFPVSLPYSRDEIRDLAFLPGPALPLPEDDR